MIKIDGSFGEGGGQILRTSLALSLVTGKAFCIKNIRAGRKKPGLMRQHLTAVDASAIIGQAEIKGNYVGSPEITFIPKRVVPGHYHFAIGTAGSCTLVLQSVLPALLIADKYSELTLEGGTHNPYAPPFDFLSDAFIPIINQMGPEVKAILECPGFYPAGGGKFKVLIKPANSLRRLEIIERGEIIKKVAYAKVSKLPVNIAHRELKIIQEKLSLDNSCLKSEEIKNSIGPGNILTVQLNCEYITEVFSGFGEKGVSAEEVAIKTAKMVFEYLTSNVSVGKYLADQLLIPMAISGGGKFSTLTPTLHTLTNAEIIKKFLNIDINIAQYGEKEFLVHIDNK
ncbi:MAG: RNA 3'-terminal phosphate cyclase [Desulfobacterales bacterium]|nr:RNA 3'-terminal phosphate cyclase [Desulfobacterales bacterium]MBF0395946.1 RNA 3'-terminal phosphate cyclase [Desulfobacterales bacterium]